MEITDPTPGKTFARVLREIVAEQQVNDLLDYLYEYYYSWKQNSNGEQININKMRSRYVDAINDLTHQPTRDTNTGTILVEYDTLQAVVHDVTYHNDDDPMPYSMQMLPWEDVANSLLSYPGIQSKILAVAHVLHEITFFGFTSDEQQQESQKTLDVLNDDLDHIKDIDAWFDDLVDEQSDFIAQAPETTDS